MTNQLTKKDQVRALAEQDLEAFIRLVHPQRVLGSIHKEIIRWMTRPDASSHQLLLLPRDHGKSAMIAYRVAWEITRDPTIRIMYMSATAGLAIKQLKFIKDILTSDRYRRYWPEMVNVDEGRRSKWTETEISVDHPKRAEEAIRDATVMAVGLTTTITGLHCDVTVLDDCVVRENAYTQEGRDKVEAQYSLLTSIEGTGGRQWVCGTRYHPNDLYAKLATIEVDDYDENGEVVGTYSLYEVFERQVENAGDGTGEFLWPKQQRYDGKWFGFDAKELARKRAGYLDKTQFRAQYYNDPNDSSTAPISSDYFQYYDRKHLKRVDGHWQIRDTRINVFASVDFAFSLAKRADYTCIVVVGVDARRNYYVLDIERFKTDKIGEYFQKILTLHQKWDFRKLRAEVTTAQEVIVNDLKDNYIVPYGLALAIDKYKPNRHMGTKAERVGAILQPKYQNKQIWHYLGGNCQVLEEELTLQNPSHDDVKDALASCIDFAVPPTSAMRRGAEIFDLGSYAASRFGGMS